MRGIFPQTDRVGKIDVGMIFDYESRRATLASQPRIDALEKLLSAGNSPAVPARLLQGFLRTGAGSISFSASATSDSASFVPSIASSSVSR